MGFRQSSGYRVLLMVLSFTFLGVAGYLVYLSIQPQQSAEEVYKQAEASYAQGEDAFKSGNYAVASERFEEARKKIENLLGAIQKQREEAKAAGKEIPKKDEIDALDARANYLRFRAIRDKSYAQAARDGKPIPEQFDSTTGEKYRSVWRIPDFDDRDQAAGSLVDAATVLTKEAAVLKEAVRFELERRPQPEWERLSKFLNATLELDPNDARAYYWLARYDYIQPVKTDKGWVEIESGKRSAERVERALRAVRKAKEIGKQPPWRLLDIEARTLEWLADAQKRKATQPGKSETELRTLLLHPSDGALATARKAQSFDLPTSFDLQGMLTAFYISAKLTARDAGKSEGDRKALIAVLRGFLEAAPKIQGTISGKAVPAEVAQVMLETLAIAQPVLNPANSPEWSELFDKYLEEAGETKISGARRTALMMVAGDLLRKEIRRAADTGDVEREKKLKKKQSDLIDATLKDAEGGKLSAAELEPLHARALEIKLLNGASAEELSPHLQALTAIPAATRPAITFYAEALIAWRLGDMRLARDLLETSLKYRDSANFLFGAQWLLYQIYAAHGQLGLALNALRDTEPYFARPDKLTALDRLVLGSTVLAPDDFAAHVASANIDIARQRIARHLRENPETALPPELSAAAEKLADAALKKLKTPSVADMYLRLAVFQLRLAQQRYEQAEEAMRSLRRDYPDSTSVLAAELSRLALPRTLTTGIAKPSPQGIKEADALIEEFCTARPGNIQARLCRIEWFASANRMDEATAFAAELASIDKQLSSELLGLFAHLDGYPMTWSVSRAILEGHRPDGRLASILVRAAADQRPSPGAPADPFHLGEIRARTSLYAAARELADGRFEAAARGFASTLR